MNTEIIIQIAGWVGTSLIVLAYFLVSSKRFSGDNKMYQFINLIGAVGVGVNVFYHQAWPALALQIVWGCIALMTLVRIYISK